MQSSLGREEGPKPNIYSSSLAFFPNPTMLTLSILKKISLNILFHLLLTSFLCMCIVKDSQTFIPVPKNPEHFSRESDSSSNYYASGMWGTQNLVDSLLRNGKLHSSVTFQWLRGKILKPKCLGFNGAYGYDNHVNF